MLGAIIGDIVGSRWEFNPTNDYNFEWLSNENAFTDDTICTVGVADALLMNRDFGESIHEWCRRYPSPKGGYGGRFKQWVLSDNPQPYNSFGNGSAMRVSPVAHWYKSLDEVLDAAAATALPSHNHDEGIKGAQTVAMAIFRALQFGEQAPAHIDEILSECVEFSGSFEDAVRKAVSLGADADTLGAIVGSIAEAIWDIPLDIRKSIKSFLPEEMNDIIIEFYEMINK